MKTKNLKNLLNRAVAAIEHPNALTGEETGFLVRDLVAAAALYDAPPLPSVAAVGKLEVDFVLGLPHGGDK